jgi:uncharacterized protein (TIGR01244 family)
MTDFGSLPALPKRISDKLYISAQPKLDEFAELSAAGFKGVISNRPDGEQANQPGRSGGRPRQAACPSTSFR